MWRLTLVIAAVGRQEDYCQFKLSLILIASPRLIGLRGKLYLKKKRGFGRLEEIPLNNFVNIKTCGKDSMRQTKERESKTCHFQKTVPQQEGVREEEQKGEGTQEKGEEK